MVLIFDVNGYIAGIQSVLPLADVDEDVFPFSSNSWYVQGDWFGEDAYFVTAYFVEPSTICSEGRSEEDFAAEGTGNSVWFQNGPSGTADLASIPLTEDVMLSDPTTVGFWYKHLCFTNMGDHYFNLYYDEDQSCDEIVPFQVVYLDGQLNGIVFQHLASLDSSRWEKPPPPAVRGIVDTAPSCLIDLSRDRLLSTLHVYVSNFETNC